MARKLSSHWNAFANVLPECEPGLILAPSPAAGSSRGRPYPPSAEQKSRPPRAILLGEKMDARQLLGAGVVIGSEIALALGDLEWATHRRDEAEPHLEGGKHPPDAGR